MNDSNKNTYSGQCNYNRSLGRNSPVTKEKYILISELKETESGLIIMTFRNINSLVLKGYNDKKTIQSTENSNRYRRNNIYQENDKGKQQNYRKKIKIHKL